MNLRLMLSHQYGGTDIMIAEISSGTEFQVAVD